MALSTDPTSHKMETTSKREAKGPPDAFVHHRTIIPPSSPPSPSPAPLPTLSPSPPFTTQQTPPSEAPLTSENATSDTNATMAPGGGNRRPPPRREADLSVVLTMPQKTDLITLVSAVIENMQAKVVETFEYCGTELAKSQTSVKIWVYTPEMVNQKAQPAPEAMSPSMTELKKDTLTAFKKWQAHVMKKLNEITIVVNSNPTQQRQGGPSRGGALNQRGNHQGAFGTRRAANDATSTGPKLYLPFPTSLSSLQMDKRKLLLRALLLQTLSIDHYASYSRILMLHIAASLRLPTHALAEDEARIAKILSKVQKETYVEEVPRPRSEEPRNSRRWKSAVGGSGAPGSGSLVAPLVAAGLGAVPGGGPTLGPATVAGLLGPVADSCMCLGTVFGIYYANKATSKMLDIFMKDVQDFAFIPLFEEPGSEYRDAKAVSPDKRRLRVVLGISGWASENEAITRPWQILSNQSEVFAMRWDNEALLKIGASLETVVKSAAWSNAKEDMAGRSIIDTLKQASWPISLMKVSKLLDNPWCVGIVRADKAGATLADAILAKLHGERGITLIGFGLAARVIYTCLMNLAERRIFTLVDSAVMIGGPIPSESNVWVSMKSVTAGRLLNVYSKNDSLLGFMYRTGSHQFGVAGLQPVDGAKGVENVDVSDLIRDHSRYQKLMGTILKRAGWEDLNPAQLAKEEHSLAILDKQPQLIAGANKENIPTQRGQRQKNETGRNEARGQRGKSGRLPG